MISLDPLARIAFYNIASSLTLHSSPPQLCFQVMVHLHAVGVDGIFGNMSFIKYLLAQLMVLWIQQMILEPYSAFIIHVETVNFGITFGQPSLNMGDSFIMARRVISPLSIGVRVTIY
jgi:hypothetical protein